MARLELTLAILKPHIIANPVALESIRNLILTSKFNIIRFKRHCFSKDDSEKFYQEHKNKFFYNRLVTFMTSGPSDIHILARENAIQEWRTLMGPTKMYQAQFTQPDSIRGHFGLSDTRNAAHGSDSPESVRKEVGIFFPNFSIDDWYKYEEPLFRKGRCKFVEENFMHQAFPTA